MPFKALKSDKTPLDNTKHVIFKVGDKHQVAVIHEVSRQSNGLPVIKIIAKVGEHIETHTWTVGADDGPRPEPDTVEQLQTKLDNLREHVATEAAWKEENHQNVKTLV